MKNDEHNLIMFATEPYDEILSLRTTGSGDI